jgi:hypothetical protein
MTCIYTHSDELFRVRVIGTSYVPHCKNKKKRHCRGHWSQGVRAMTCTYMHSDELFRVRVIGTSYVPHCKNKKKSGIAEVIGHKAFVP